MHQPSLDCASADRDGDTGETCLPYMVGTEYRFSTRNGEAYRRLAGADTHAGNEVVTWRRPPLCCRRGTEDRC